MPDTIRCPGCGLDNPADRADCSHCHAPLRSADPATGPPPAEPEIFLPRPVRRRRPRPRPAFANPLVLWGSVAAVVAAALAYNVFTGTYRSGATAIAGATLAQQRRADSLSAVLARDSTDLDALVAYANILYDTANWADAARRYDRVLARDSSRTRVLVDLAVCRYNQGDAARAEQLLLLALQREPRQPVALFNLGIVHERAGDEAAAVACFRRALAAAPPAALRPVIVEHLQGILQRTGRGTTSADAAGEPPGGSGR